MPRRQILSSEEQERLLVIPDDEIILTRMCFLNEPDIALINKHRRPANRLGFAVLLCYRHCCKVSDEAAFCLIQRPYISKTLLTRRISPRGSP